MKINHKKFHTYTIKHKSKKFIVTISDDTKYVHIAEDYYLLPDKILIHIDVLRAITNVLDVD